MEKTTEEVEQHNQDMLNKFDENQERVNNELKTDEEKMYAGKFNNVEDLEKSYQELQKKLGNNLNEEKSNEDGDQDVSETVKENTETPSTEEAKNLTEDKGFNFDELSAEYQENGDLTEETYKKLEEAGIPKAMVDNYVQGQQAVVEKKAQDIYNTIGGEGEYQSMISWASDNLSDADKDAFNSAINVNDAVATFTIQSLYNRYKTETPGQLVNGDKNTSNQGLGYETKTEMMKDMSSQAYKKDPTFRAMVQRKVEKTNWL
jgi:hypothetical protein